MGFADAVIVDYDPIGCHVYPFSMFFYQKHSFFDIFTVYCPLVHVFVTHYFTITFWDSLLGQGFRREGLRLCTKVYGLWGGSKRVLSYEC